MTTKLSIFKISDDSFQVEFENPSEILDIISRYSDRKVEVIPNQNLIRISGAPKKCDAPEGLADPGDTMDAEDDLFEGVNADYPPLLINLHTNYDKIYYGAPKKVYGLVEIKAPEKCDIPAAQRKALNIIAAIDVSGSMSGKKIECARDSVIKLIDNLTDGDHFGVVLFDTEVKVLSPMVKTDQANRDGLKRLISTIASGSSTNMAGAMGEGYGLFKNLDPKLCDKALNRMIVFTDGMANVGVTGREGFMKLVSERPSGLSISTFGYGSDHDENLLRAIADNGRGNFYYIQNTEFFLECLATEIGGLMSTYALDIKVQIRPSINVVISKVINDLEMNDINGAKIIDAGDIQLGEKKYIAVWFTLPQVTKAVSMRQFAFAEIRMNYKNNNTGEEMMFSRKFKMSFVKSEFEKVMENEFVREKVIMLHFGNCQKKAMAYADAGDIHKAQDEIKRFLAKTEKYHDRYPCNKTIYKLIDQAQEVLLKFRNPDEYRIRRKEIYIKQSMFQKQRTYSSEDSAVEMFETNEKRDLKERWRNEENERRNAEEAERRRRNK